MQNEVLSIENNRFLKLCEKLNIKPSNELKKTEMFIVNYDKDKDCIEAKFHFLDVIKPSDFFAFRNKLRKNKIGLNIEHTFIFDFLSYSKDNIYSYIKYIVTNKPKYELLKKFDFKNNLKINQDFQASCSTTSKEEFEKLNSVFENLNLTLKKCGFDKLNLTLNLKELDIVELDVQEEEKKRINKELYKKMVAETKDNEAQKVVISKVGRNNYKYKKYTHYNISDLSQLEAKTPISASGLIYKRDYKQAKNGKHIYTFLVTDFKDAFDFKWFKNEPLNSVEDEDLKEGSYIKFLGSVSDNSFNNVSIVFIDNYEKTENPFPTKKDNAEHKRIEIHVSSKMNTLDGILRPEDIVEQAKKFGMDAVGIMDTDGVQGYPAFSGESIKQKIKPLYGAAFSTLNKENSIFLGGTLTGLIDDVDSIISFDIETTGLSPKYHEIIEFGATEIKEGKFINEYQFFIKSKSKLSAFTTQLTGITDSMVQGGLDPKDGLKKIYDILNNKIAIAHNAKFDFHFLKEQFRIHSVEFPKCVVIDTLVLSRILFDEKKNKLIDVANRVGVVYDTKVAHRGDYDANVLARVWLMLINIARDNGFLKFEQLAEYTNPNLYKREFTYEFTTLVKNDAGLKEQYKLVSKSHTDNFYDKNVCFVEDLINSKNLLIGSGTLKGCLINDYFFGSEEKFLNTLKLVDFVEIPAPQVFEHWVKYGDFTQEQIYDGLKNIIEAAIKHKKIPVATGDVKYVYENEKVLYEVLVYAKGIKNARHYLYNFEKAKNNQLEIPTQSFLTTDEMIKQFSFLNDDKLIEDVVINNTHKIADMCDNVQIVKEGLFAPSFDNSSQKLRDLVYKNAKEKYGENLPEFLKNRIESELNPIIKHGFDVIYWISHLLVKKATDNGAIVGSRGSVGSSIVARLSDISEVNPLPPHYLCNECKRFEIVDSKEIGSGFDLPKKKCPSCKVDMERDGQNIPFETFLGFKADKVPDIDLNFSGDFQGTIHDEIRRLFGEKHTLRAGTIATAAFKTCYGYVKNYLEETHKSYSDAFISYIATRIEKVKRTTGQHPGGIIIIPKEFEFEDFTPINYPANDTSSDWYTTHFDYRAIHDNVLKFDILGHDNPTIMKMLEEYTNINRLDIPMDDPKVIDLFTNTKSIGIKPSDISNEETGALGLPEFGTTFVREMLKQSQPKNFANLISVSGLSHGTNVWLNNAQELIMKRKFTLNDVISCRDDILEKLIREGVEPSYAFKIMEIVRKGKTNLFLNEVQKLKEYKIPNWQIESMKKIEYMFPKAHATAYVLMAWWIGWFKIYYPLAFYGSYFAIHAKAINIEKMVDIKGGKKVSNYLTELKNINKYERSTKENELIPVFEIAEELYARKFYISNIDLHKSLASKWVVDEQNQCLIPPFDVIDGLGVAAAESVVEARQNKPFISVEDFIRRTSVNKTLIGKMTDMGIFKDLEETNQMKLF
ncbi:PolC-type DNA polymerase III [Mycoplasma sp. Mirounga ES2805-ORL]|uniref:PolC-type DNA polymerase III n=1 Tax=Mycoplasma sp. Mirounga ES2805-ORL TaxID=754514 RepID=UPI00197BEAE3|nr:PolC-type DNA polymerase III [Mycoplasma sp. Mirounga ES2805-ORL]QSF13468.1 PolC-type DNA polymerase III [Mycoplasma sp. Mirounga ES2805-ORL]